MSFYGRKFQKTLRHLLVEPCRDDIENRYFRYLQSDGVFRAKFHSDQVYGRSGQITGKSCETWIIWRPTTSHGYWYIRTVEEWLNWNMCSKCALEYRLVHSDVLGTIIFSRVDLIGYVCRGILKFELSWRSWQAHLRLNSISQFRR